MVKPSVRRSTRNRELGHLSLTKESFASDSVPLLGALCLLMPMTLFEMFPAVGTLMATLTVPVWKAHLVVTFVSRGTMIVNGAQPLSSKNLVLTLILPSGVRPGRAWILALC